jgi:hypothetical protein
VNGRRAGALLAVALLGAQAGHLLTYQVRFAGAAGQLQGSGAHSYFPVLAKTLAGGAGACLLGCLLVIGLARVVGRRRVAPAPSLLRLLAALFTLQLAIFAGQEVLEARLAGAATGGGLDLVLWGTIGQLPAAAAGALALRWLAARFEPAVAELKAIFASPVRPWNPMPALVPAVAFEPAPVFVSGSHLAFVRRRGPPSSSLFRD